MSFASLPFAVLFAATLPLYWAARNRRSLRTLVLIAASYVFYAAAQPWFLILLLYVSLADYWFARRLAAAATPGRRKAWLTVSVLSSLSLLAAFKYANFLLGLPADIAAVLRLELPRPEVHLPLPLGISFFVFQTISYVVEVHRGVIKPCERPLDYLLFISFFPRMSAGPIVRAGQFLPQLEPPPVMTRRRFGLAVFLLISGFTKKLVLAEYLRLNLIDRVFDLPLFFSATENLAAAYGSVFQLYCDFSGYMDIVIALGLLVGLELPDNFSFPFQARNNSAFWRRWHITLSTWLRDFLYIPLGGNRKGRWRGYFNLLATMVLAGLWHGAAWTYILMGLSFGLGLVGTHLFVGRKAPTEYRPGESKLLFLVSVFATFHFLTFTWVIYKSRDVSTWLDMLGRMVPFLEAVPNVMAAKLAWAAATGGNALQTWGFMAEGFAKSFFSVSNLSGTTALMMLTAAVGTFAPPKYYERVRETFVRLPWWAQLAAAGLALLVIYKMTAFKVTPFEYQRF
jgi:D-alanyl-lipoteichoic acid acyltransferase DltB (MBOAT superfamily)